jgi:hypothetical protein
VGLNQTYQLKRYRPLLNREFKLHSVDMVPDALQFCDNKVVDERLHRIRTYGDVFAISTKSSRCLSTFHCTYHSDAHASAHFQPNLIASVPISSYCIPKSFAPSSTVEHCRLISVPCQAPRTIAIAVIGASTSHA